jgi:thiol-disulfide isomerase/thioredoxin
MRRLVLLAPLAIACQSSRSLPEPAPLGPRDGLGDYWVQRSDAELDAILGETCAASVADGRPVLLWFSAAWCGDCRRTYAYEKAGALDDELTHWHRVVIEPGRLDRHVPLFQAMGVSGIPTVVATRPTDCGQPAQDWPRLDQGRFDRPLLDGTPARLLEWMEATREP